MENSKKPGENHKKKYRLSKSNKSQNDGTPSNLKFIFHSKISSKLFKYGSFIILVGILLGFVVNWQPTLIPNEYFNVLLGLISHSLIVLGLVTILVDFPNWRSYFGDRLKEIILDRSYLNTLSEQELDALQYKLLKAKYKNSDINKEGSVLEYLVTTIQPYASFTYREGLNSTLVIEEINGKLRYKEHITFALRNTDHETPYKIVWTWNKEEGIENAIFKLQVQCPVEKISNKISCVCDFKDDCANSKPILIPSLQGELPGNEIGHIVNLNEKIDSIDNVKVHLTLEYEMGVERMYYWNMSSPSKDVTMHVSIPEEYKIETFIGGMNNNEYSEDNSDPLSYIFIAPGWMLPRTGIAINLYKSEKVIATPEAITEIAVPSENT